MKKILLMFGLAALMVPAMALAAEFKYSNSGSVSTKTTDQSKNLYISGSTVTVDGGVTKDLVAAGSDIVVNGNVENSVLALGSNVTLKGNVGDNVRAAGTNVAVSGRVSGDLLAAGTTVTLSSGAIVAGDFLAAAGTLNLAGDVGGNVTAAAGTVNISGHISGDVKLSGVTSLTVDASAVIDGKLTYRAESQGSIDHDAVITGGVDYQNVPNTGKSSGLSPFMMSGVAGMISLTKIVGGFLFLLLLISLLPKTTRNFVETAASDIWASLGWGLILLIIAPVVTFMLVFLIAPIGIAAELILLYIAAIIVSCVLAFLLVGTGLYKALKKEKDFRIDWLTALFGIAVVTIIHWLPLFGTLFIFIAFLVSFGTLARMAGSFIARNRK